MKRKTIQVKEELHTSLKYEALKLGITVQELVERIIDEWLKAHSEGPEVPEVKGE